MVFQYIDRKFRGEGIDIYSNRGIHIETGDQELLFKGWDDVREFMADLEEINQKAILHNKRFKYGKNLVVFPDEGEWVVWWKRKSITISQELLKQLPIILRFFLRRYHKIMLDYGSGLLGEEFLVETNKTFFTRARNNGIRRLLYSKG